jgi:hypothetical protein
MQIGAKGIQNLLGTIVLKKNYEKTKIEKNIFLFFINQELANFESSSKRMKPYIVSPKPTLINHQH